MWSKFQVRDFTTLRFEVETMLVSEQVQLQILLCSEPIDMRKGANALTGIIRDALMEGPLSGKMFVFQSKRGDSVKIFYRSASLQA